MPLDNPLLRALKTTAPRIRSYDPLEDDIEGQVKPKDPGLLKRIGSGVLSGLSVVGNVLDMPGSMVRDALSLENPLDQLLTPTTDENRVSGRDLLRKAGVVGPQDTWGNFAGGLGTEILLDPLTYISPGGLLKGAAKGITGAAKVGQAAKAGGGLLRAGIPLVSKGGVELFTGPGSIKAAEKIGGAAEGLKYAKVPGTEFQPLNTLLRTFRAPLKETVTPTGQKLAENLFETHQATEAGVRTKAAGFARTRQEAGLGDDFADPLREAIELPGKRAQAPAAAQGMIDEIKGDAAQDFKDAVYWGDMTSGQELKDLEAEFFYRRASDLPELKPGSAAAAFVAKHGSKIPRLEALKNIKGGTVQLKQIIADPDLEQLIGQGATRKELGKFIEGKYGGVVPEKYTTKAGKNVNQRRALGSIIAKLPPELRKLGLFGNDPLVDYKMARTAARQSIDTTRQIVETLAQPGILKPAAAAAAAAGDKSTRSLGEVFKALGIKIGDKDGGAVKAMHDLMGMALDPRDPDKYIRDFAKSRIDAGLADDLLRVRKAYTSPEPVRQVMQIVDNLQNWSKSLWTTPWPAFHARNVASGQFDNWVAGTFSFGSVKKAWDMLRGKAVAGAARIPEVQALAQQRGIQNLTDDQATKLLGELLYGHKVIGKYESYAGSVSGAASRQAGSGKLSDILEGIPGEQPFSFGQVANKLAGRAPGTSFNPLDVRGVGGRTESGFAPVAAGEDLSHFGEFINRVSPMIQQLERGVPLSEAAAKVGATQVQYQNKFYTKTEQEVLKRLFPFYSFTSRKLPWTLQMLLSEPGGKLAQTIRTVRSAKDDEATTPDYVAQTASIPLGESADGGRRYVTGLGLSFEDPLSLLGGGVRGGGLEVLSRMNPLLKGPLEYVTGESFFQTGPEGGRALEDMDPTVGRILANVSGREQAVKFPGSDVLEAVLGNSPAARLLTTARQLTDKRKGIGAKATNLLTGIRVSDISPAAQDAKLRELVQAREKELGAKKFQKVYFPEEVLEGMTPRQREAAQELIDLSDLLGERAKGRKKARQKAA